MPKEALIWVPPAKNKGWEGNGKEKELKSKHSGVKHWGTRDHLPRREQGTPVKPVVPVTGTEQGWHWHFQIYSPAYVSVNPSKEDELRPPKARGKTAQFRDNSNIPVRFRTDKIGIISWCFPFQIQLVLCCSILPAVETNLLPLAAPARWKTKVKNPLDLTFGSQLSLELGTAAGAVLREGSLPGGGPSGTSWPKESCTSRQPELRAETKGNTIKAAPQESGLEKNRCFQAWLKIARSNFFVMPSKIGNDRRNEKSAWLCSNHSLGGQGDHGDCPKQITSTVIFPATPRVHR